MTRIGSTIGRRIWVDETPHSKAKLSSPVAVLATLGASMSAASCLPGQKAPGSLRAAEVMVQRGESATVSEQRAVGAESVKTGVAGAEISLDHLNFLGDWSVIDGTRVHYTWIYADYVDGKFVRKQADNMGHVEGMACVDDVARAAVVYLNDVAASKNQDSLERARGSLEFILKMQADDGRFHNFVYLDGTRNETGVTSFASHGWWAARALWAMARGLSVFKDDTELSARLSESIHRLLPHLESNLSSGPAAVDPKTSWPTVPPAGLLDGAGDLTSTAVLALSALVRQQPGNRRAASLLTTMADGLAAFQNRDKDSVLYGAHYSFVDSHWHGWGNRQMWALAEAAMALPGHANREGWLESARLEADTFFPKLLAEHIPRAIHAGTVEPYDQIAYAIGSMAGGLAALHRATGNEQYAVLAGLTGSWFFGNNPSGQAMYREDTGVCLDGIEGPDTVATNSGAESTIEALLALQQLNDLPAAADVLSARVTHADSAGRVFATADGTEIRLVRSSDGESYTLRSTPP